MTFTTELVLWTILAIIGIAICAYMLVNSFFDRAIAATAEERTVTWGDTIQWSFGLIGKLVVLFLGLWVALLPERGTAPGNDFQSWGVAHSRTIFASSLIFIVFSMDMRDLVLVALKQRLQYLARHDEDEPIALTAANIQREAADVQLEAAKVQQEASERQAES